MKNIKLFIMSFWIFFVLLIIVTIELPICFGSNCEFIGYKELFSIRNSIAFVSILLFFSGILFYHEFMTDLKGDLRQPITIEKIENVNSEYFTLLVTIISLVTVNYTNLRGLIFLVVLLLILGAIFIKTELFYSNPSFALMGFHIYKADTNNELLKNKILITKDKIKNQDKVKYMKISEKVYFTKKA